MTLDTSRADTHRPDAAITDSRPEDDSFWQPTGRKVANRNPWISIPALMLGFVVQNTGTAYWEMTLIAAVVGIGGANFSSSMANIGFFFPKREKDSANGNNRGLGNLGVSAVQLVAPPVVTAAVLGAPAGMS